MGRRARRLAAEAAAREAVPVRTRARKPVLKPKIVAKRVVKKR